MEPLLDETTDEGNVPDENEYPDFPEEEEEVDIGLHVGEDEPEATNTTEDGKVHDDQQHVEGQGPVDTSGHADDTAGTFSQDDKDSRPGSSTPRIVEPVLRSEDKIGNGK